VNGLIGPDLGAYCRHVESYLCRRNGGHLIRIVGPAFERVRSWAERGVPIRIVERGIDRYLQRQQDRSATRRPARIEFCEADVLDVFDEWKRAVGRLAGISPFPDEDVPPGGCTPEDEDQEDAGGSRTPDERTGARPARGPTLPEHIARAQVRLSSLLSSQPLPDDLRRFLDDVLQQLEGWHAESRTARGERRQQIVEALDGLDPAVAALAWDAQDHATRAALVAEATEELAPFRTRMSVDVWQTTVDAAARRLLRDRLGLPALSFS
jgi:hypothetical protein